MKLKSKMPITKISAVVLNSKTNEFILHSDSEFDMWYDSVNRDEFLSMFKLRFANLN